MSITLNWSARGQTADNIKIYRGTVRDAAGLTLLGTLPGDATEFIDNTAADNKLYYYRVNIVIGAEEVPGMIIPNMNCPDTGPGPKTLVKGTMEWGYFGKLTQAEFFTSQQLRTTFPGMANWGTTNLNDISFWRKYACNGTIIYIPDSCLYLSASVALLAPLNALYTAGLYYGNNKNQKVIYISAAATMQNAKTVKDQYEFMVRAPKALANTDGSTGIFNVTSGIFDTGAAEIYMVAMSNSNRYVNAGYIGAGVGFPVVSPIETAMPPYTVITQHFSNTTTVVTIPLSGNGMASTSLASTAQIWGYLPILELILG